MSERNYPYELYQINLWVTNELEETIIEYCQKYGCIDFSWPEDKELWGFNEDQYLKAGVFVDFKGGILSFCEILKIKVNVGQDRREPSQSESSETRQFYLTVRVVPDKSEITITDTLEHLIPSTDDRLRLLQHINCWETNQYEEFTYSEEDVLWEIEGALRLKWDEETLKRKDEISSAIRELQKLATQELNFDKICAAINLKWADNQIFTFDKEDKSFLKDIRKLFHENLIYLQDNLQFKPLF